MPGLILYCSGVDILVQSSKNTLSSSNESLSWMLSFLGACLKRWWYETSGDHNCKQNKMKTNV